MEGRLRLKPSVPSLINEPISTKQLVDGLGFEPTTLYGTVVGTVYTNYQAMGIVSSISAS